MILPFSLPVSSDPSLKKTVPSGPQLPENRFALLYSVIGVPPCSETFLNPPPAVSEIYWPSGEKNGIRGIVCPRNQGWFVSVHGAQAELPRRREKE